MDSFDNIWFGIRRYFFSGLLILAGLIFIIQGVSTDEATSLSQSKLFLYGGISSLALGALSLYFLMVERIPKAFIIGLSVILLGGVVLFSILNYHAINDEIVYQNEVGESKELAKQGLVDIQKIQDAYDKKYQNFATSFDSLIYFAKTDSISVLIEATGEIPTRRMSMEEAKKLGLRDPKEVISEDDAIKLELIIRRYEKVPVAKYLFSAEKTKNDFRKYDFDIDKLAQLRTIDNSSTEFVLRSAEIDSAVYGVEIVAVPPYGPQRAEDIQGDTLKLGSLTDRKMNTNWKK
jgi:Ca2+/Na+ antiporter